MTDRPQIRSKRDLPRWHRRIVSGESRGLWAAALRGLFWILSLGYEGVTWLRNRLYDSGCKTVSRVSVPVVSLGNLTAGGTGKTPLAAYLAEWFRVQGIRPAILSRGYAAGSQSSNDEGLVLQRLVPDLLQFQDPDRVASAQRAITAGADVLILDDAFQHRRIHRDLNLLLIDGLDPWGGNELLPRGYLRESLSGVRRADLVLITRADAVAVTQIDAISERLRSTGYRGPIVRVAFVPKELINAQGETRPLQLLSGQSMGGFCGIGNPAGFWKTLEQLGCSLNSDQRWEFPDHHAYQPLDLDELGEGARRKNCQCLVTTLKDLVKIPHTELHGIPLWGLNISAHILAEETALKDRLRALFP